MSDEMTKQQPTVEQFGAYRAMFDHFNETLFAGELPAVFLNFSRHSGALGFFAPLRWQHVTTESVVTHEISLNPAYLASRPARETAATLVHEMCHLWQQTFGTPPSRGYHDRQWAGKMVSVGLQPVDPKTGKDRMSAPALTHRIVDAGAFARAFDLLPAAALLPWTCAEVNARVSGGGNGAARGGSEGPDGEGSEGKTKTRNKVKFTCPECGANAWGKPSLQLLCDDDHSPTRLVADGAEASHLAMAA